MTVNADGGYSFTPNSAALQALGAGQTATAQVTYTAQNSAGSASTTLTLTATGVNDAPVAGADAALTVAPARPRPSRRRRRPMSIPAMVCRCGSWPCRHPARSSWRTGQPSALVKS
ncbi:VCBS domain-containing protein [Hankyongella ginsenosidimutans]|uniref:VCBS domain-containing protein n=1 Tax=Hankyongella ginsenosidimutans TaxID=1763828 RepID=UPI003CCC741F